MKKRITFKKDSGGYPLPYIISLNGIRVGRVSSSAMGWGYWVRHPYIAFKNSWEAGERYETLEATKIAAKEYIKACLEEKEDK